MTENAIVTKKGGKIELWTPWLGRDAVDTVKSIRGARWNPSAKVWTYPLAWSTCTDIRKATRKLGVGLTISPDLAEWAKEEKGRRREVPNVQSLERVPLPRLEQSNPALYGAMQSRPFQTVGAKFGATNRRVLLADDPGLGKTLQTIAMFEEAGVTGVILVVAPKSAVEVTWPAELARWVPGDRVTVFGSSISKKNRGAVIDNAFREYEGGFRPPARHWIVTTSYYVRASLNLDASGNVDRKDPFTAEVPEVFNHEWSGIVLDESHRFVAGATGNKKKQSKQWVGLGYVPLAEGGIKAALSGTPFRGKAENLFGTLNWLQPAMYTSYWKWVDKHFEVYTDYFGYRYVGPVKSVDEFYREAAEVMVRREKGEVAKDLPPKLYGGEPLDPAAKDSVVGVWLDMTPKQRRAYEEMTKEALANIEGGTLIANGVLPELTRLKQFATCHGRLDTEYCPRIEEDVQEFVPSLPSNKFDWLVEFLESRGIGKKPDGDGKVVIASQFTQVIKLFAAELERMAIPVFTLTGETPPNRRKEVQRRFQSETGPECTRVFLLNTVAGGVSLTLDAADDVVIVDETFIPDDQLQVEDRAHRLSRTDHTVTVWYLRSRGTIEESIGATTAEREALCRGIMDGARGVDVSKSLLGA